VRRVHNTGTVSEQHNRPVATLWQLELKEARVFCTIYRDGAGLQLRLESANAVIIEEPFALQPRMLARTQMLRDSLKRRGWSEVL